jgi:hypothetical protein
MDDEAYILALTIRTELVPPANARSDTLARQEKRGLRRFLSPLLTLGGSPDETEQQRKIK